MRGAKLTVLALLIGSAVGSTAELLEPRDAPHVQAGPPEVALEHGLLLVALPLENHEAASVTVSITRLQLHHHSLVRPGSLPLALGAIKPGEREVAQLAFQGERSFQGEELQLSIEGTAESGAKRQRFTTQTRFRVPR